jgi:hypothetical protein
VSDRELLTECLDVLTHDAAQRTFAGGVRMSQLAIKLRAALAAPSLAVTVDPRLTPDEAAAISSALAAPSEDIEALRRDAERYRKQKERSHRLQRLLKECVKVMQANVVFRDTKVHKDLKARIRIELEDKR